MRLLDRIKGWRSGRPLDPSQIVVGTLHSLPGSVPVGDVMADGSCRLYGGHEGPITAHGWPIGPETCPDEIEVPTAIFIPNVKDLLAALTDIEHTLRPAAQLLTTICMDEALGAIPQMVAREFLLQAGDDFLAMVERELAR